MAKFKFTQTLQDATAEFGGPLDLDVKPSGNKAVWTDSVSGGRIVIEGKNLEAAHGGNDLLAGGRITGGVVMDVDGNKIVTISDLSVKATGLMAAYQNAGNDGIFNFLTQGDDEVIGTRGADWLIGGNGDDVMTGKAGADTFQFQDVVVLRKGAHGKSGAERDIITDFDVEGDDADSLSLLQGFEIASAHHGHDTRLDFDDGSTLLLKDVTKSEFEAYLDAI
jgi:Ca2+-binding RTX toxin-like protein